MHPHRPESETRNPGGLDRCGRGRAVDRVQLIGSQARFGQRSPGGQLVNLQNANLEVLEAFIAAGLDGDCAPQTVAGDRAELRKSPHADLRGPIPAPCAGQPGRAAEAGFSGGKMGSLTSLKPLAAQLLPIFDR